MTMIKQAINVNANSPKTKHNGLDGFSLDCYTPKWDKGLHLWRHNVDIYFQPVIDLANYLLDFKEVDADTDLDCLKILKCNMQSWTMYLYPTLTTYIDPRVTIHN